MSHDLVDRMVSRDVMWPNYYFQENIDIYATKEPQEAFHQRILFCLEREQQDLELAKEMTEEDEEEDFP